MGIIWAFILISLLIWFVFGWDYMVSIWGNVFEWIGQMGEAMIERTHYAVATP